MTTYSSKDEALARLRSGHTPASEADRYDVSGIGPDEFDGGAWGIASHRVDVDGTEYEAPHAVHLGSVIAQPADVRALRLHSVQWHGGTGRVEDPDAGALADTARASREATRALVGPDGCNLTRTTADGTTRERWNHLSADAAAWLHAVNGTECPDYVTDAPEARTIAGAIPGNPRRQRVRHGIALDTRVGRTVTRTRDLQPWETSGMVSTTGWDTLPHTARTVTLGTDDKRTEQERNAATPERAAARTERARWRRMVAAQAAATVALRVGEPISGRSDSLPVRLTLAASLVSAVSGGRFAPVDVLAVFVPD